MNTNKAAYWVVVGVLALGLNSEYRHGGFTGMHRLANCANILVRDFGDRAKQSLAEALLISRDRLPLDSLRASTGTAEAAADAGNEALEQAALIRDQARDRAELFRTRVHDRIRAHAEMIHAQAEIRRAEMEQFRTNAQLHVGFVRATSGRTLMVCPKTAAATIVVDDVQNSDDVSQAVVVDNNL